MKTRQEILRERDKLIVVAAEGSPVPKFVRSLARDICHALTWILDDDVEISPYNSIAGCCCFRPNMEGGTKECSLGVDMCLCPADDVAPEIPGEDPARPRGRRWTPDPPHSLTE